MYVNSSSVKLCCKIYPGLLVTWFQEEYSPVVYNPLVKEENV